MLGATTAKKKAKIFSFFFLFFLGRRSFGCTVFCAFEVANKLFFFFYLALSRLLQLSSCLKSFKLVYLRGASELTPGLMLAPSLSWPSRSHTKRQGEYAEVGEGGSVDVSGRLAFWILPTSSNSPTRAGRVFRHLARWFPFPSPFSSGLSGGTPPVHDCLAGGWGYSRGHGP